MFTTTFSGSGFGAHVYDLNLSTGGGAGVAVNGTGAIGYRQDSGDIGVLNVTRFLVSGSIPEPAATNPGAIVLSPDGHSLVVVSSSWAIVVRL